MKNAYFLFELFLSEASDPVALEKFDCDLAKA